MEHVNTGIEQAVAWLVAVIDQLGILGIFIMTFLESTFTPIPSELTMIPAGYLVHQGQMDLASVLAASVLGTIAGSYFSYWIARYLGRGFILRYGNYFLLPPQKLEALESFFARHGAISVFIGRLILGMRHFISFPAGLARMDVKKFLLYTAVGGAIWMSILIATGFYIGENKELMVRYLPLIKFGIIGVIALLLLVYLWRNARNKRVHTN